MTITSKILVVVDPDQGFEQPTIQRALLAAGKSGSHIELFSCHLDRGYLHTQFFGGLDVDGVRKHQRESIEKALMQFCARIQRSQIACTWTVIDTMSFTSAILQRAAETEASMVIKETRYHRKIARALLSHTDWDLIRECSSPLWLAKAGELSTDAGVVACIDPSHPDEQHAKTDQHIIARARELGVCLDAKVDYFHAMAPMADYAKPFVIDKIIETAREQQRETIERYKELYQIADERLHIVEGFPEHTLKALIEELGTGVVVIGAIARHGPQKVLLGSTAERLLDRVSCDVLVIKPEGFGR